MVTSLAARQNSPKLRGVHPQLVTIIGQILASIEALGFPMLVTDGLRTQTEQAALYAQGRTTTGQIVTNADGLLKKSNHQAHDDGYGHAVDCCFLDADGQPSWSETHPWALYGAMAQSRGLIWGGGWKPPLIDRPHVELP